MSGPQRVPPVSSSSVPDRQGAVRSPAARVKKDSPRLPAALLSAGNAAVSQVFRSVDQAPAAPGKAAGASDRTPAEEASIRAVEARMERVAQSANTHGRTTLFWSDMCVASLKEANEHLSSVAKNYGTAHDQFTAVLKRADKEYEADKAIADEVQGVAVSVFFAVALPEAIATKVLTSAAAKAVEAIAGAAARASVSRAVAALPQAAGKVGSVVADEIAEKTVGAGVDQFRTDTGRPSDSAALAGPDKADKLSQVLGHLNQMIGDLPVLGSLGSSLRDLGFAALEIARAGAQVRAGDRVDLSVAELEQRARTLEEADSRAGAVQDQVGGLLIRMLSLRSRALAVQLQSAEEFENKLWTRWMAALTTDQSAELLDNDEIEKYLGPTGKKMFDFGSYTSDSEQRAAVTAAQRRWLASKGVDPGKDEGVTLSKFKGYTRLDELRAKLIGRRGKLLDRDHIAVEGEIYRYSRNAGSLPEGSVLEVQDVAIPRHLQGDVYIDQWDSDDFVVDGVAAPETKDPLTAIPQFTQ